MHDNSDMKRFLVLQMARFGDLVQTGRLLRTLDRQARESGGEVHLAVDASLAGLARLLYPFAVVHDVPAHGLPAKAGLEATRAVLASRGVFAEISRLEFDRVFCLNFSPLGMAVSAMFPPEVQRGYRMTNGQIDKDALLRLVFRLARDRRGAGINLADIWAHLAENPVPPATVNPPAKAGGGGLGLALAGRMARRSLPPEVLAPLVRTLFLASGGKRLVLFGTAAQAPAARALWRRLEPTVRDACLDLTGKTSLTGLADALSGLDRLLTPDTGIMHLAAFCGVPVTAVFLSSAWCHETGPYGAGHQVWQAVTPCAPCLESAPCGQAMACLAPFADPVLPRLLAGSAKVAPPPGLVGFATDNDALGVVCRVTAGEDPSRDRRERLRLFLARHLGLGGLGQGAGPAATPDLAEEYYLETDWVLPAPGRPFQGEW